MSAENLLVVVVLGGLLGMAGQSIRVIAGIKKLHNDAVSTNTTVSELFQAHTLVISLMIGFVAGLLCALSLWDKLTSGNIESSTAFAVLGAGYAGADFIEAFMRKSQAEAPAATLDPAETQSQPPAVG